MYLNRRPDQASTRGMATLALTLLLAGAADSISLRAQDPPFPTPLPMCYAPPSPETDGWPKAVTDSLGSTAGAPVSFDGATLLANDVGTGLAILSVGPSSNGGGSITGAGPYVYTPDGAFGADAFPYQVIDANSQTTMGIVKISVTGDSAAPTVSITSPLGGSVSGNVLVKAAASDNVGVTSVTFFDGATPIGGDVTASPYEVTWPTATVANGSHTLTAIARDAAGHATTSAAVVVDVNNVVMVSVPSVVGLTRALAVQALTNAGLVADLSSANSPSVPIGSVLDQAPIAGTSVVAGSHVSVVTSLGALVPNVVGATQSAASSAITVAGLTLGAVTAQSSTTVASGSVISQNPAGGASAAPGSAVAIVVSSGAPVTPPPATGGLVLAFGFEEVSGAAVVDSADAPKNGAILGAIRVAAGKFGRGLSFDGVNDWVTVTDTTASKIDLTTGMTVEAWVNPTSMSGWETVVMKERGAAGTGLLSYALYAHDGAPQAGAFAGPAGYLRPAPASSTTDQGIRQASHTPLPLNAWTHIAVTYDGANMRFYIGGSLVGTKAQTGSIAAGNQPLRIGGNNMSGEFFNGLIDEVRVYNRALSAAEIATDMNTPVVQ
jgi:hypothetical protein